MKKINQGIYESQDGKWQVRRNQAGTWDLYETDREGGWDWSQRYPTKGEAWEAIQRIERKG